MWVLPILMILHLLTAAHTHTQPQFAENEFFLFLLIVFLQNISIRLFRMWPFRNGNAYSMQNAHILHDV